MEILKLSISFLYVSCGHKYKSIRTLLMFQYANFDWQYLYPSYIYRKNYVLYSIFHNVRGNINFGC
jgi:hypothetical protein